MAAEAYVAAVRRHRDEIGKLEWAAPQDWMCEPLIVAKTGLSVPEHLRRTVASFLQLTTLAPDLRFIPVLQGWELANYLACAAIYEAVGVDLAAVPLVRVGSVCRRQTTDEIGAIMQALAGAAIGGTVSRCPARSPTASGFARAWRRAIVLATTTRR